MQMEFDKDKYKVIKLPHPALLFLMINPGISVIELVLGRRIAKVTLVEKSGSSILNGRQYIPCPECNAIHDYRLWTQGNTFGHWFGYVCPNCHGKIPCIWTIPSIIALALTFPIWIWLKIFFEDAWLEKEKSRFAEIPIAAEQAKTAKKSNWLKAGLLFGIATFGAHMLIKGFLHQLSPTIIAAQFVIWMSAGLLWGFGMKLIYQSRKK